MHCCCLPDSFAVYIFHFDSEIPKIQETCISNMLGYRQKGCNLAEPFMLLGVQKKRMPIESSTSRRVV